jgi:hypothetical protein
MPNGPDELSGLKAENDRLIALLESHVRQALAAREGDQFTAQCDKIVEHHLVVLRRAPMVNIDQFIQVLSEAVIAPALPL